MQIQKEHVIVPFIVHWHFSKMGVITLFLFFQIRGPASTIMHKIVYTTCFFRNHLIDHRLFRMYNHYQEMLRFPVRHKT